LSLGSTRADRNGRFVGEKPFCARVLRLRVQHFMKEQAASDPSAHIAEKAFLPCWSGGSQEAVARNGSWPEDCSGMRCRMGDRVHPLVVLNSSKAVSWCHRKRGRTRWNGAGMCGLGWLRWPGSTTARFTSRVASSGSDGLRSPPHGHRCRGAPGPFLAHPAALWTYQPRLHRMAWRGLLRRRVPARAGTLDLYATGLVVTIRVGQGLRWSSKELFDTWNNGVSIATAETDLDMTNAADMTRRPAIAPSKWRRSLDRASFALAVLYIQTYPECRTCFRAQRAGITYCSPVCANRRADRA
jgi:hypothetical protein